MYYSVMHSFLTTNLDTLVEPKNGNALQRKQVVQVNGYKKIPVSKKLPSRMHNAQTLSHTKPETAALIVAAGSSIRFGQDKLMALVNGEPLINYSLKAFAKAPSISSIVLVVSPGREEEFSEIIRSIKSPEMTALVTVVTGGKSRHDSVQRGMRALAPSVRFVAIHDAARPLITVPLIEHSLEAAYFHGASSLAVPVTDTLHRAHADGYAEETINREKLWAMQTPQVFRVLDLINGLSITEADKERTIEENAPTDEVSALLKKGVKVHLVENTEPNIKVTYPRDLDVASALLTAMRVLKKNLRMPLRGSV